MTDKPKLALQRPSSTAAGSQKITIGGELTTMTVQIPSSVHRALKRRAIDEGKKLRETLLDILADAGVK